MAHINVNSHTFESHLQALQAQKTNSNYNVDVGNIFTLSNKQLIYDDSLEDFAECNETKQHHQNKDTIQDPSKINILREKRARQSSKSKRKIILRKKVIRYTFIY